MRHNISAILSWEIRSNAFLRSSCAMNTGMFHSRANSVQRSIMYTASAPCLCGMKAVCSVFQERGGTRCTQEFAESGQATDGTKLIETSRMCFFWNERRHDPKPCLLKVARGEHILYLERKAHNLLLKQCEKHLSRHSVPARLALFQLGQTLPDITWGDFNLQGSIVTRAQPEQ